MLVPMSKVELIGPKTKFFDVLSLLHELGTVHVQDLSQQIDSGEMPAEHMELIAAQEAEKERLEELLLRLRSVIGALHVTPANAASAEYERYYAEFSALRRAELIARASEAMSRLEPPSAALVQTEAELQTEIALLNRYEPLLRKIQPLASEIIRDESLDSVALLVDRRYRGLIGDLEAELASVTKDQSEVFAADVDERTTALVVVFSKRYSAAVHAFLDTENVNQVRLPSGFQDVPFDEAYEQMKRRREEIPGQLGAVRRKIAAMGAANLGEIAALLDVLSNQLDEVGEIPMFGETQYEFVMTGWLPAEMLGTLTARLDERFGDEVSLSELRIDEDEYAEMPVALRNPKFAEPMQALYPTLAGGMPRYGSVDPTVVLAVFYPLIFGLIVGDIAYGTIMLGIVLWLRHRFRDKPFIQTATAIFGPAAIMAILVGIVYGEFFGNALQLLGVIRPFTVLGVTLPLQRTAASMLLPLIGVAIGVGVIQVSYGLVLGVINALRRHRRSGAYLHVALLTLVLGMILAALAAVPALEAGKPVVQIVSAAALLLGFFGAMWFGKIMGFVEVIELVSHIASYIRIMAIGLAGAVFADAVNELVRELGWIIGGLLGLILHALNIVISSFSPNIHALRLNFLEFFTKFYEPGAHEYKPFQRTRR